MNPSERFLFLLAFLVASCPIHLGTQAKLHAGEAPEGVFDHSTVEEAWKVAITRRRPLLVMFTSDNCTFCKKMIADTYSNPQIKRFLRGRTESVLAHSDDYASLVKKLGIRGYPSSLLISPEGEVLDFIEGYLEPKAFAYRVGPLLDRPAERVGSAKLSGAAGRTIEQ